MDDQALTFLEQHPSAAMVTLRPDGTPHAVRIGLSVVDGKVWSSGTQSRKRTAHLRRDPRSTLFVFDNEWRYLTLECRVRLLEGPDAPDLSIRLFQAMQSRMNPSPGTIMWYGAQKRIDEFRQIMVEEQRLIYEFDILRTYGMYQQTPGR